MKLFKQKKASLLDVLFAIGVLTFFGIILLFGFTLATNFNAQLQSNANIPAQAKITSTQLTGYYSGVIDNMFLFLTIGMCITILILAALVRVHPIFIPIYIIAMLIAITLGAVFSNIYTEAAMDPNLAPQAAQLTFTSLIIGRLPLITGIIGFILMMILYKQWRVDAA